MKEATLIRTPITNFTTTYLVKFCVSLFCVFAMASCKSGEEIGLNLQGEKILKTRFTDTLSLQTSMVLLDSVNTTNTSTTLVGGLADADFGTTQAESYARLSLGGRTKVDFGKDAVYDSISMQLTYNGIYGDSSHRQTYFVHEIKQAIDTVKYYQFQQLPPSSIGKQIGTLRFAPTDDSLTFVRFRLSDTFGKKIFEKSGKPALENQANFSAFVNGIRISTKDTQAVLGINSLPRYSFITLHYRIPSGDTLAARSFRFHLGRGYHSILSDFTQSETLQALAKGKPLSSTHTKNECFLQAGIGLATHLRIPNLKNLAKDRKILINRAELFFRPLEKGYADANKPPPDKIYLRTTDGNGKPHAFLNRELSTVRPIPVYAQYNSAGRAYSKIRITTYLQQVLDNDLPNNGLFLTLSPTESRESVRQVTLGDAQHPTAPRMKLEIYYTVQEK